MWVGWVGFAVNPLTRAHAYARIESIWSNRPNCPKPEWQGGLGITDNITAKR